MDTNRAIEIIDRFPAIKALVVGDVMVDHFVWGKVTRISPEAPVPVVNVIHDELLLGGCANVMNNIRAVEGQVYLTGVIGSDDMGKKMRESLSAKGVATDGVFVDEDRHTTVKTRVVAHNQQVVRFDRETQRDVSAAYTEKILRYVSSLADQIDVIVVSDYHKGMITPELLQGIREVVAGRNIRVCVDPKRSDLSFYHGLDVITPNHHEAERAMEVGEINGNDPEKEALVYEKVMSLLERINLNALLITRGKAGMSLYEANGSVVHIPSHARAVYDVTGAGDAVIAVFSLCIAAGATLREAAEIANHAAGIVVGKVGTATVYREELRRSV
ncbi:MAG: D-glycero-beta-D-manno-heptose-7-phosphate kinase [Syntrophobacterales bacterium]|jgi:D-beta-D-heptose 7-phosphate kinase/D-beta-D-heptose 1-phosphate adenosyltransferase|nr:D-glycero-beta-D-manno-heptose-7-phosphate kinase [Syntrophobacterales bacterium]